MKFFIHTSLIFLIFLTGLSCTNQKPAAFKPHEVLTSDSLTITRISENTYVHTSFLKTDDFGLVPCNGLVIRNGGEVIIFDTPASYAASGMLITWVREVLHDKIKAVIPTHFHKDCLGELKLFQDQNVPSYGSYKTIGLARANGYTAPDNGFTDLLVLSVGTEKVIVKFFGEGHTKDNVVGYFPKDEVLFGGCLVKEVDATKGFLGDANVNAWSATVEKVKQEYPDVKLVVPGHGKYGDKKLLEYTIDLFRTGQ